VAAALSGKSDGLTAADIHTDKLKEFFAGQKLNAGSSGWLAEAYAKDPSGLDGLINYESVILSLNAGGTLQEPLVAVYPKEGIITSDYPLMLINPARRAAYDKLVAYLKTDAVQAQLMAETHRRPAVPAVKPAAEFGSRLLIELPFPAALETLDALLTAYQDDLRRPGHAYFVLDTSGSMGGERIRELKDGLRFLTAGEGVARFSRFALREKVDLIPFANNLKRATVLDFGNREQYAKAESDYSAAIASLNPNGGTAIYDAVLEAYRRAAADALQEPDRYYSIVLMTDGENTDGRNFEEFKAAWNALGDAKGVRVFPILFGDASTDEMKGLAELTGGKAFDGRKESLARVFKEIRGYQ
jgi:Ca-activated chloride channel family protein